MATEDFHHEAKHWAGIKHVLLAKYLSLFVGKTGKGRSRVYYVDAFAGPGMLDDGSKGSAIYAAEVASSPVQKSRRDVLKCINVEADAETFAKLQASTAQFVKDGHVLNLSGRFEERREESYGR
jgi:three-Cys-motif partner protein